MAQAIPRKGAVLTQISAFWFGRLADVIPSHFITADTAEILRRIPSLREDRAQLAGRAMLCRRTTPISFECVVRGYLSGSAWKEYAERGTLAGELLPPGLVESARLEPPIFSPATKAASGHDENVPFKAMEDVVGRDTARRLREASFAVYRAGRDHAASCGIIIADTKFEFGFDSTRVLRLIDEVMTPDSSRFWPADRYQPGHSQPSFDKQPLRDWLEGSGWDKKAPGPVLPDDVVEATRNRYVGAYERITGQTWVGE
jgi:phosphoribosylaminoimidazole-succinocarboxamide synthase